TAGVLFRGEGLADGGVKGYRVGLGNGAWGRLEEEHGRGPLASKSTTAKAGGWNRCEIVATGPRLRISLTGGPWLELTAGEGARRGTLALQAPAGAAGEVRFKDLRLELDPR